MRWTRVGSVMLEHGDSREAAAKEIQEALRLAYDSYAQNKEEPPAPKSAAAASLGRIGVCAKSSRKSLAARMN